MGSPFSSAKVPSTEQGCMKKPGWDSLFSLTFIVAIQVDRAQSTHKYQGLMKSEE